VLRLEQKEGLKDFVKKKERKKKKKKNAGPPTSCGGLTVVAHGLDHGPRQEREKKRKKKGRENGVCTAQNGPGGWTVCDTHASVEKGKEKRRIRAGKN